MAESPFKRFGLPGGPDMGNRVRAAVLRHLANMRSGNAPAATKLGFAGHLLTIPELDYYVLTERFPDLKSQDAEIKLRAWKAFANSELGEKYRSTPRRRRHTSPNIIIPE